MVVNNWAITMMGYAYATNRAAMVYFYAWFFIMVVVVLNIVTAFLLDDFTVMQKTLTAEEDDGKQHVWKETALAAAAANDPLHARKWQLSRKTHPIHVYERMFEDEVRVYLADMEARQFADATVLSEIVRHSFSARHDGGMQASQRGGRFLSWGRQSGSSHGSSRASVANKGQAVGSLLRGRSHSDGGGDTDDLQAQAQVQALPPSAGGTGCNSSMETCRLRSNTAEIGDGAATGGELGLQRQDTTAMDRRQGSVAAEWGWGGDGGPCSLGIRGAAARRASQLGVELDPALIRLQSEASGEIQELRAALMREGSLLDAGIADDLLRVVVGQQSTNNDEKE
jgi:hypothetical protein